LLGLVLDLWIFHVLMSATWRPVRFAGASVTFWYAGDWKLQRELAKRLMSEELPDLSNPEGRRQFIDHYYREHSRELWAHFYALCSDPERALDAVQECFLRFYDYSGEPIRDPRAWLLRVGQNWLRDVARKKSSSCRLLPALDDFSGRPESTEENLSVAESQTQVREALKELNDDDRKVLVMKYAMDWSAAQMATVLGCSTAALDMRVSRARRRLAEILVERGFDNE
jgi:RNA polymerase sigma factor (sigma-70 family)